MKEDLVAVRVEVPKELYKRYSAHVRAHHGYVARFSTFFFTQVMEAVLAGQICMSANCPHVQVYIPKKEGSV
jgi:hypothetical protein